MPTAPHQMMYTPASAHVRLGVHVHMLSVYVLHDHVTTSNRYTTQAFARGHHMHGAGHKAQFVHGKVVHHNASTFSLHDIFTATLAQIDAITVTDTALFVAALKTFLRRVKAIETEVGHRVLCDDALRSAEHHLEYIVPNIVDLYHSS